MRSDCKTYTAAYYRALTEWCTGEATDEDLSRHRERYLNTLTNVWNGTGSAQTIIYDVFLSVYEDVYNALKNMHVRPQNRGLWTECIVLSRMFFTPAPEYLHVLFLKQEDALA